MQQFQAALVVAIDTDTPYPDQTMANYRLPIHPDYRLRRLLPSASPGDLYLAERRSDRATVVLQVVPDAPGLAERLSEQIARWKSNPNPNLVKPLALEPIPDRLVIVHEYSAGISLVEWICSQGRVSWRDAVNFTSQAARLLQEAHSLGVSHGSLAPEDFLLHEGLISLRGWTRRCRRNAEPAPASQDAVDLVRSLMAMLVGRSAINSNEAWPFDKLWPDTPAGLIAFLRKWQSFPQDKAIPWLDLMHDLQSSLDAPARRSWWQRWWPFAP
jgi:serine/threonine protein kinase